jgi:hypothetical protein
MCKERPLNLTINMKKVSSYLQGFPGVIYVKQIGCHVDGNGEVASQLIIGPRQLTAESVFVYALLVDELSIAIGIGPVE